MRFNCTPTATSVIGLLIALQPSTLLAQTSPAAEDDVAEATASAALDEAQDDAAGGDIVVTGSLLRSDVTSASPISVITSEQILQSGSLNLSEVLKRDPAMGVNARSNTLTINGAGASNVNLRNLGSRRTLALLNGRRLPLFSDPIGTASQDTTVIPPMLISRVEMLKDGASTLYGADAVAGVVNFILLDKYDGLRLDGHYGISQRGDGRTYRIGGLLGHTFDRGSIIVSASFENQDPIPMNARSFTHPAIQTLAPPSDNTFGIAATPGGRVLGPGPATQAPIACFPFGPGAIANPFNPACPRYDTATESSLIGGSELLSLGAIGRYELFENVNLVATVLKTRRQSFTGFTGVSSSQIDTTGIIGVFTSGITVPAASPNNSFGRDIRLRWRPSAYGRQPTLATSHLTHVRAGLEGKLFGRFDWEVSHTYSSSDAHILTPNLINSVSLFNLLIPASCAADPVCRPVGAIPNIANMLSGAVPLTSAQQEYLFDDNVTDTRFSSSQTIGTITGTLFSLPAGAVRIGLGAEHRKEFGRVLPDEVTQSGVLSGKFVFPTNGRFSTDEVFGEIDVPLLKDAPLAEELNVNLQGRHSRFSNFGGATTYKIGVNYIPIDGIRLRGAYGTSFRAPDVLELYGGGTGQNSTLSDPCNVGGLRATNPQVNANCTALGVPATFTQQTGGALPTRGGGNLALQPERGRTYTLGAVLTPSFLPGFSATIDYYSILIRDAIGTGNLQLNLNSCYGDPNLVARASDPLDICFTFADRLPSGSLGRILARSVNSQRLSTSGIDFTIDYRTRLSFIPGTLSLTARLSHLRNFIQQGVDLAGTFVGGVDGSSAFPRWRGSLTANYSSASFDLRYQVDYVHSMRDQNFGTSIPVTNFMNYSGVPRYHVHSLFAQVNAGEGTRVGFGIDNLFDREPPFALVTTRNSLAAVHDQIGRYFYLTVQRDF